MRFASKVAIILAMCAAALGQQKINPNTGINWPAATGNGAPAASCTSLNYGQLYTDLSITPNMFYTCGNDGWQVRTGPPGPPGTGSFGTLQGGTNTSAAMIVGSGASINHTGSGTIDATTLNGNKNPGLTTATVVFIPSDSPIKTSTNNSGLTVQLTGTSDQTLINSTLAAACPNYPNVVGCLAIFQDGHYNLSAPIVINSDGWQLSGLHHSMWGGYQHRWQAPFAITSWTIASNVACFVTGAQGLIAGNQAVVLGFGTSTFFNNFTGTVLSSGLSSTSFCMNFTHANGSATEAGQMIDPVGAIGTGNAQLVATGPGYPLIQVTHTNPCGNGTDTVRCRGWEVSKLYGVCYGYSGDFIDVVGGGGSGDDNIMVDDNVIQRCNKGINGTLDSPTLQNNSFQDNLGAFAALSGLYLRAQNNLVYDNGGLAYSLTSESGCTIQDRAWGDLNGGIVGGAARCTVTGNIGYQLGPQGGITLTGFYNTVTGNTILSSQGKCISFDNSSFSPAPATESGTISGNSCGNSTFNTAGDQISILNMQNIAITGNAIANDGLLSGGAAINATGCTNCTIGINTAPGKWNYGGPPIVGGPGNVLTGNLTTFVVNQGIASITSAYLLARYQATNATPATNGTTITGWTDSSGLGYSVTNFYGTPTYTTSSPINSAPAINFNGSSGTYTTSVLASATVQPRSVWIVFNQTTGATGTHTDTLFEAGGGQNSIYFNGSSNDLAVFAGTAFVSTIAPSLTTTHILEVVINGTSSRIVLDGTTAQTFSASTTASGAGMGMGAKQGIANNFFTGYIAEEAYYNGANTAGDAQTLGAAYCTAYGVSCGTSW